MSAVVYGRLKLPRRFASHLNSNGVRFREHFIALQEAYGPFHSELARQAAADAAQAFVIKLATARAWEQAQVARTTGKGRRPNARQVINLSKRVALDTSTYEQAVRRLQAVLAHTSAGTHDALLAKYQNGGAP